MDSQGHLCRKLSKAGPNSEFRPSQEWCVFTSSNPSVDSRSNALLRFRPRRQSPGALLHPVAGQISDSAQTPHEPVFVDLSYLIMFQ